MEMKTAALIATTAATVAMLVCIAVGIGGLLLQARIRRFLDQAERTLQSEITPSVRAWGDAARGISEAAGKLNDGFAPLARTLERADRLTEKLDPEALGRTVLHPALAKLLAWVAGVRKGLASVRGDRHDKAPLSPEPREGDRSAQ